VVADFQKRDKHIVKAFLMGPAARDKLMAVAGIKEEVKYQLYPYGGVMIFVDEIFLSPDVAVPLYKRPKDLAHARKIWAEQIIEAVGIKDSPLYPFPLWRHEV
jgi:hypothetical protein